MYFDRRLWALMRGVRGRIAAAIAVGLVASFVGIARFAALGWLLALVFRGAPTDALALPIATVAAAVLLRGVLEHARAMIAHRTASRIQEHLRGQLYDKVAALGPAWFAGERTGGVMLSIVDGVEQLQTFFGQYLPQLCVTALTPVAIFIFIAWWDVPVAAMMLVFALLGLVTAGDGPPGPPEREPGPPRVAKGLQRGVPRRAPGPRDPEGVRPERRARADARRPGARAVARHDPGARDQPLQPRDRRLRRGERRGGRPRARRVPGLARAHEPAGAADHPHGRDRDLPAAPRPPDRAAPGARRAGRGDRDHRPARRRGRRRSPAPGRGR